MLQQFTTETGTISTPIPIFVWSTKNKFSVVLSLVLVRKKKQKACLCLEINYFISFLNQFFSYQRKVILRHWGLGSLSAENMIQCRVLNSLLGKKLLCSFRKKKKKHLSQRCLIQFTYLLRHLNVEKIKDKAEWSIMNGPFLRLLANLWFYQSCRRLRHC